MSQGDSLQRPEYLKFIKELKDKGFEIGIRNIGSGDYTRDEVIKSIEEFKAKPGEYPKIHVNHSYNKDSIYGEYKRFNYPNNVLVKKVYPQCSGVFQGDIFNSKYLWEDIFAHLGYFMRNGKIDDGFITSLEVLSKNENGIYMLVSKVMEKIAEKELNKVVRNIFLLVYM